MENSKLSSYRLEAQDENYGDDKVQKTRQTELRIHPKGDGNTMGCVSVCSDKDYSKIDKLLQNTSTSKVQVNSQSRDPRKWGDKETLDKLGTLEVIDNISEEQ